MVCISSAITHLYSIIPWVRGFGKVKHIPIGKAEDS